MLGKFSGELHFQRFHVARLARRARGAPVRGPRVLPSLVGYVGTVGNATVEGGSGNGKLQRLNAQGHPRGASICSAVNGRLPANARDVRGYFGQTDDGCAQCFLAQHHPSQQA